MLSRTETTIWRRLERLEEKIEKLERWVQHVTQQLEVEKGRTRARLKEAADDARGR